MTADHDDPLGVVGVADAPDITVPIPDHDRSCVVWCRSAGPRRRGERCSHCWGKVTVRDIYDGDVWPVEHGLAWQLGRFCGGWAAAWHDAIVGTVRGRDRVHTRVRARAVGGDGDHPPGKQVTA